MKYTQTYANATSTSVRESESWESRRVATYKNPTRIQVGVESAERKIVGKFFCSNFLVLNFQSLSNILFFFSQRMTSATMEKAAKFLWEFFLIVRGNRDLLWIIKICWYSAIFANLCHQRIFAIDCCTLQISGICSHRGNMWI